MCKKMIYLVSFVLVLSLVSNASADLVGHWRFDEGSGTIAYDSSGNGNDGTLEGDPQWVAGKIAGALQFDGTDDYVEVPDSPSLDITDAITIAAWVFREVDSGNWERIVAKSDSTLYDYWLQITNGDSIGGGFLDIGGTAQNSLDLATGISIPLNQWTHLAYVYDGTYAKGYVNGQLDKSEDIGSFKIRTSTRPLWVGRLQTSYSFDGLIDEVRIYNKALTLPEILGAMEGDKGYPYALGPVPADGAILTDTWVSLGWRAGDFAVSHDIYLGDNFDDVNDGAADTFRGNQDLTSTTFIVGFFGFPYPDGLVPGTTYYWRIDEVNDTEPNSPWKGAVWSFMVPPKTAYDQYPADGAKFIDPAAELSWTAGFNAKLHTVYFGDNFDDVNSATVGIPSAFNTYSPGTLELDKTYYWRIDEFDGVNTHKGDVWSFKTLPVIPITDPNLIGWWKLDEGMGTTAVDWSGHDNHGTLVGDPQWVDGYDGGALEFDGADDYVNLPYTTDPTAYTIAAWVKPAGTSAASIVVRTDNAGPTTNWSHQLRIDSSGVIEHYTWDGSECRVLGTTAIKAGTWYSVVAVATNNGNMRLYVNGRREGTAINVATLWAGGDRFLIGSNSSHGMGWFEGFIDDIRIYDRALTQEEITIAMRGDTTRAWNPSPSPGSTPYIREATPLNWSPGDNAAQHDVYLGIDKDVVADANTSTTDIYRGRQFGTSYTPPEGVEWGGGPYYWRIDEYNTDATISKGSVWSFTVVDFIVIDDFEDYDVGNNEIWWSWIDGLGYASHPIKPPHPGNGTGSMVGDETTGSYMEETIVHGGNQSMPVFYDNSILRYSEVEKTLTYPRDWTENGVNTLTIWFRGISDNAAETLYVALNGSAVVAHDNPNAAQVEEWTEWTIDLQVFADQGVNLANVNTIAIGFGNKKNPVAGGSGTMYFDDIRLYRPAEPAP